ncbi:MAG TPA: response regulator [Anaeromyxobacteraceae bacterium]|nr:response regulator [Anaeromyxobacteraceae bacterium]
MTTLSRSLSPLVLLVEDDTGLREVVARGLARAGYLVASAGSRTEAVASARELSPDAVVMDVSLPDGEGPEAAEEIRRQRGLAAVPVLFVTARPPAVVRDSLFPAPVLFKPFSYRQLVAAVRALLPQVREPAR